VAKACEERTIYEKPWLGSLLLVEKSPVVEIRGFAVHGTKVGQGEKDVVVRAHGTRRGGFLSENTMQCGSILPKGQV